MKKSTKLIIEIVAVVAVFAVASVVYNKLEDESPSTSYVPTVNTEKADAIVASNEAKIVEATSTVVQVESNSVEDQTKSNESVAVDSVDATVVDDKTEAEVQQESSLMPDIPVVMYPSKEESTFWNVIPKGKPVVINLFASWCPPCKAEMPYFVEARNTYKDDVTFVFFDSFDGSRETEKTLKAFVDKTFEDDTLIVMDPGYMGYIFNSNSIPLTIMLNAEGEVVNGFSGSVNEETLIEAIEKLLL